MILPIAAQSVFQE